MTFEIAERKPTNEELDFAESNLAEIKRMFANLHYLKLQKSQTDLNENIKSVKDYLKKIFNFNVDLQY